MIRPRSVRAIIGLLILALTASACSSSVDPTGFIEDTYQRESSLDEDGVRAYVAEGKDPESVATEVSAAVQPLDRRTVSEQAANDDGDPAFVNDSGNAVFLQYREEIVAIFPYQDGSRVMLGEYRRAHNLYFAFIGGFWGSSPNYGGGGSGNRGGGPGSGK